MQIVEHALLMTGKWFFRRNSPILSAKKIDKYIHKQIEAQKRPSAILWAGLLNPVYKLISSRVSL